MKVVRQSFGVGHGLCLWAALAVIAGCTINQDGITFEWLRVNTPVVDPIKSVDPVTPDRPIEPRVPDPVEEPIVGHELRCLILEEVSARGRLPLTQLSMLTGANVRAFLNTHCVKDTDGSSEYRIVDKSTVLTGVWAGNLGTKAVPTSYPWIVLVNGRATFSGPLPVKWDELKTLLDKYAGVVP